jgi:hypothetical protein
MAPRTVLGAIDGNRGYGCELTPNQRGKIEGAKAVGSSFKAAADLVNCTKEAARKTVLLSSERHDGQSKPRIGRSKSWDDRFERRVLRIARINPKTTYQQMREALHTHLSHDTLSRILSANGITKWLAKKRPYISLAAVKKRYRWALFHKDWSFEEWTMIIWSDECSVERGAGARRTWVFRTPGQKWDKEMIDTYDKGKDISVMVWGAIWVGGKSDLYIIARVRRVCLDISPLFANHRTPSLPVIAPHVSHGRLPHMRTSNGRVSDGSVSRRRVFLRTCIS